MTISKVIDLKKALVNAASSYFKPNINLADVTMWCIMPRNGYDYGFKLKHVSSHTVKKFYLRKDKLFYLDKPIRMISKPSIVGIGDECVVFTGTIDLDIPNLNTLLPSS